MIGKTIHSICVGDCATSVHTVTEEDVIMFAKVTGDYNPMHFDENFANQTKFKKRIVHGMILAGYISEVIGMKLPGNGTLYEQQSLKFLLPVFFNDIITTKVEIIEIDEKSNRVHLKTQCFNQEDMCVLTGEAIVLPPKERKYATV